MKTIAVLFAMFIGSLVQSQNAESGKINVSVPNVNETQAAVHFPLHTAEDYGTRGNSMNSGPPNWEESKFDFDSTSKDIEIMF